ncbi:hypothetical protein GCM10009642_66100 [Nocardiopsis metallicus]
MTLAAMIITPATAMIGRWPMVMDIRREPEPVMIGMMIIAPELPAGGFSGICGGVAMTRGFSPGEGGSAAGWPGDRSGRHSFLSSVHLWGLGVWVTTLRIISRTP